eukprot:SAG22_NODE_1058_length_5769_cov_6.433510_5_plen_152_part_00
MLPNHEDRHLWRLMLYTGYYLKLVDVAHIIYRQVSTDVFFVDWEKSWGELHTASGHHDHDHGGGGGGGGEDDEEGAAVGEQSAMVGPSDLHPKVPVSCWRTLFITNEWSELQTVTQTSPLFTLFLTVFLLGAQWNRKERQRNRRKGSDHCL